VGFSLVLDEFVRDWRQLAAGRAIGVDFREQALVVGSVKIVFRFAFAIVDVVLWQTFRAIRQKRRWNTSKKAVMQCRFTPAETLPGVH
jgi:hypothetical protein